MTSSLVHPGNGDAYFKIINSDAKAVLYYTAVWCPPCKAISPVFDKLCKEYEDIAFVKIDVDALPEAADHAEIRSVPTFKFRNKQTTVMEVLICMRFETI